ncbi:MAG TPA: hypothetical protein VK501_09845 [Baekduia sp.]|uniref:hypothetical protein n=1 Tax=Baekduia sp. TaxID=2600305 RepID=UPI002C1D0EFA|nr:hypothetical protein [Baekduia sp.]HMJ34209.1 hypothetical protein [Baekduia sp.]
MSVPTSLRLLALPVALLTAVLAAATPAAPAALADDPVATTKTATAITADAGVAAWRADDGRLTVRIGSRAPVTTSLRPPAGAPLDVGARSGGGAQLIYASGCSTRSDQCSLRTVALSTATVAGTLRPRTVTHVRYGGGGAPAVAIDGSRIAYAVRRGSCDVPYVRTTSQRRAATRRLDRGHCATIEQLDLGEGRVAVLAGPGNRRTEARVIRATGGPSRTLQAESQGEESNFVGAVSIDGGALYTARGGIRQANVFSRFSLKDFKRTEARAFVSLVGPFARDAGRQYYDQQPAGGSLHCDGTGGLSPCLVVAGSDAFASGERLLAPALALTVSPQPVFTDTPASAVVTAARRSVTRTAQAGSVPVGGLTIELLSARLTQSAPTAPAPTGATATTGADGVAAVAIPGPAVPRRSLGAVSRPGSGGVAVQTPDTFLLQTFVHLTATPERLADGRLRVSGTISPAQPGRKVRLDRRLERVCNGQQPMSTVVTPSTADTPAGCVDRWTQDPLATAAVSADGASYSVAAATPAGVYRVSLDFAGGADVLPGESPAITAP